MDVAVLGATGDVGRLVCTQLVERRVLPTSSRLQLVGRPGGGSAGAAHGLRADLVDAYDEHAPLIDVALRPEDVVADIVVVCAGRTGPARVGGSVDRAALAAENHAVFATYARALAEHGSGHEVVIVVANPVELGVATMARELGRHRVLGMGAWLDTLRFRREVAVSLGVRRQRVGGFVAGQHGADLVPLWSTVTVRGLDPAETAVALARVRGPRSLDDFEAEVDRATGELLARATVDVGAAFDLIDTWPPDLRVVTRPWLTHQSGAKTAAGTANATVGLVDMLVDGRETVVAGQVLLAGELSLGGRPVHGVLGVPVVLGPDGWSRVLLENPAPDEQRRLAATAGRISALVTTWEPASTAPAADRRREGNPGVDGPSRAQPEERWLAVVHGLDQPGTLTVLTGVFATRGVSVDSVTTERRDAAAGTIQVTFRSTARRRDLLVRTLRRLSAVHDVTISPAPNG